MTLDVINAQQEKVGSLELSDAIFGGRVKLDLVWEGVVHQHAAERRGTHATKNRARVSGSGRKPWRQKGTGRARVGEIRNPLWRKGGTVFGPQPRSYAYALPRKVVRGALRAALAQKIRDEGLLVVDRLTLDEGRTKAARELLAGLGVSGKAVLVDVKLQDALSRSARNLAGIRAVRAAELTARDVMDAPRVVVTAAAMERLQSVLSA